MKFDKIVYFFAIIVFFAGGISIFFDKLAANRLGNRSFIPVVISNAISLLILLSFYLLSNRLGYDRKGMGLLFIGSFLFAVFLVFYYLLFARVQISWLIPIIGLNSIIPIILGFLILKESLTINKIIGIVLSMVAIAFLSI